MKHKSASIQPDLFVQDGSRALPTVSQTEQLATLIEALLLEIAVALDGALAHPIDEARSRSPHKVFVAHGNQTQDGR